MEQSLLTDDVWFQHFGLLTYVGTGSKSVNSLLSCSPPLVNVFYLIINPLEAAERLFLANFKMDAFIESHIHFWREEFS